MKFNYKYGKGFTFTSVYEETFVVEKRVGNYSKPAYLVTSVNSGDTFTFFEEHIDESIEKVKAKQAKKKVEGTFVTVVDGIAIVEAIEKEKEEANITNSDVKKECLKKYFDTMNSTSIVRCGRNISQKAFDNELTPCFCREKEIEQIKHTMFRRTKPNVMLLGKAGTGKTAIVEQLAYEYNNDYINGKTERYTMVIELSLNALVSGSKYRGDFEQKIEGILREISEKRPYDIVLFIDEIHAINEVGSAEGSDSAGQILKPALARGEIKLIGATTTSEYNEYLKNDAALCRRFNNIEVKELTGDVAKKITRDILNDYGKFFNTDVSSVEIEKIYENNISKMNGTFPDNFINVIDETLAIAKCDGVTTITNVEIERTMKNYINVDSKSKSIGFSKV